MTTTKSVQKRIERYSLFAAAMLATGSIAKGEIVHTNLDPDESVDNDSYLIDFDNDGTFELSISHSHTMSGGFAYNRIYATGLSAGADVQMAGPSGSSAAQNNYFDPVSSLDNFANQGLVAYYFNSLGVGEFSSSDEGYLGVRFETAAGTHYGWVRLDINPDGDGFVVGGYGYEAEADEPILAGDIECLPPANSVELLSPNKARLSWDTPEGAGIFKIKGRKLGASFYTRKLLDANSKTINGLLAGASYEWQIRSFCLDSTLSEWTELDTFTMPSMRESVLEQTVAYIADNNLYIQAPRSLNSIRLIDISGREVFARNETVETTSYSLANLASGVYLLEMGSGEDKIVRELVK